MPDVPAREWSDDQIRRVGVAVARMYLEVERGLRPREHLRRFLTPYAYAAQLGEDVSRYPDAGPVRGDDIGPVTYARVAARRSMLNLVARQHGDRWGAICVDLQPDSSGRWYVAELTRVHDRNLTRPYEPPPREPTAEQAFPRRLQGERIAIDVALVAARSRRVAAQRTLEDLSAAKHPDRDRVRAAAKQLQAQRQQEARWQGQLAAFEADAATRPRAGSASLLYLEPLLGPEPAADERRTVWRAAAGIVETYRRAAGITEETSALGPPPREPALIAARAEVIRNLDEIAKSLVAATPFRGRESAAGSSERAVDAPSRDLAGPR